MGWVSALNLDGVLWSVGWVSALTLDGGSSASCLVLPSASPLLTARADSGHGKSAGSWHGLWATSSGLWMGVESGEGAQGPPCSWEHRAALPHESLFWISTIVKVISFPRQICEVGVVNVIPLHRWGCWRTGRVSTLPEASQLAGGWTRIQSRVLALPASPGASSCDPGYRLSVTADIQKQLLCLSRALLVSDATSLLGSDGKISRMCFNGKSQVQNMLPGVLIKGTGQNMYSCLLG